MTNVALSGLPGASSLTGSEIVPVVQGVVTKKTTTQDIANLAPGAASSILVESGAAAKISSMSAASTLAGTESIPAVQSGGNVKATAQAIANLAPAALLVESGAAAKTSALSGAGALAGTESIAIVQSGATVKTTAQAIANLAPSGGTPANPTAIAKDTAVNGVATTYMRSDASPAVQKTSSSLFGLAKVDGVTITASAGVITAVTGGGGDVVGPASAVNNRVVFFDGTTGKLVKDSGLALSGSNTGDQTITLTGNVTGSGAGSFATTIAAGVVTEAMQVLANNTTGNVSTTKHGYAPILPNDATKYLDGTGAYTVPPTSGGVTFATQTGTSYTPVLGDASVFNDLSNSSPITLTIPTDASVAYPIVTTLSFAQAGSGVVTIVGAGGVTIKSAGSLVASNGQDAVFAVSKIGTNTWRLYGNLA